MRRRSVAAHACLASVAILGLWSSPPVSVVRAAPGTPRVSWSPCYRELGLPFECGTVQVPLDHDGPAEAAISIALVRLAATGPGARIGSLFFNPGGPGGSGVDFLLGFAPFIPPPLRLLRSHRLRPARHSTKHGGALLREPPSMGRLLTPFPFPVTAADEAVWAAADQYLIGACDQRAASSIDHMSTADAARDLDLLREAVGDELLWYVGYSYGSYLGVTYANLFPDRFRALVVDGVLDPVAWATGAPGEAATLPFSTRVRAMPAPRLL